MPHLPGLIKDFQRSFAAVNEAREALLAFVAIGLPSTVTARIGAQGVLSQAGE